MIHICYKFQEIPFSSFLIMAQDRQNQSVIGQELKDYQGRLSHPDPTSCVIVIHIFYKFHEIPFSGFLVMLWTDRGQTEGWTERGMDRQGQNYFTPPSAGITTWHRCPAKT